MLPEDRGCRGACPACTAPSLGLGHDGSPETCRLTVQPGILWAEAADSRPERTESPVAAVPSGSEKASQRRKEMTIAGNRKH